MAQYKLQSNSKRLVYIYVLLICLLNKEDFAWVFDLTDASYHMQSLVSSDNNNKNSTVVVELTTFAHREYRNVIVTTVGVVGGGGESINASSLALEFAMKHVNSTRYRDFSFDQPDDDCIVANTMLAEVAGADEMVAVCRAAFIPETLCGDESCDVALFVTSIASSTEKINGDLLQRARHTLTSAMNAGAQQLSLSHRAAWRALHEQYTIEFDGASLELAQTVNASKVYLLSALRDDYHYSVSPGGITTNSYNGHVFWDADLWMFQALINFVPNIASSIVQYRIDRLDVAMQYANNTGYAGARFAWETASTGFDVNPSNDSRMEDHVSGDVVLSLRDFERTVGSLPRGADDVIAQV